MVGRAHVANVCVPTFVVRLPALPLIVIAADFLGGLVVWDCLCMTIGRVGEPSKDRLVGMTGANGVSADT